MEFSSNKLNDDLPIILPKKGEKRLYSTFNDTKKTNLIFPIFDYLSNDSQNDLPIILPEKIKKPSILELAAKNILGKNENLLPNINK
jgi:hypothetical protein